MPQPAPDPAVPGLANRPARQSCVRQAPCAQSQPETPNPRRRNRPPLRSPDRGAALPARAAFQLRLARKFAPALSPPCAELYRPMIYATLGGCLCTLALEVRPPVRIPRLSVLQVNRSKVVLKRKVPIDLKVLADTLHRLEPEIIQRRAVLRRVRNRNKVFCNLLPAVV